MTPEQALLQTLAEMMTQRDALTERVARLEADNGRLTEQVKSEERDYIRRLLCDLTGVRWQNSYRGWDHELGERASYTVSISGERPGYSAKWERTTRGHYSGTLIVEGTGDTEAEAIVDMVAKYNAKMSSEEQNKEGL
jgi:hypothetical protein